EEAVVIGVDGGKGVRQQALGGLLTADLAVLVGVELQDQALGRGGGVYLQPTRGVGVAGVRALLLGPGHQRGRPGRPALVLGAFRARERLVLEIQHTDMPQRLRSKPTYLDVVLEEREWFAELV